MEGKCHTINENSTLNVAKPEIIPRAGENIPVNENDVSSVENIENTSSSSPEEITRENSMEKDDADLSSLYDINDAKKDELIDMSDAGQMSKMPNTLPTSNYAPQITTKMSVKDRMAVGKF